MQVTVFGANGNIGSRVVERLLTNGHTVRAFVHGSHSFEQSNNLQVIQGDIGDKEQVAQAIDGSDAVVSALGSWGTKSKDILTVGMTNIIPAMQSTGVRRIVSLTGADARDPADQPSLRQRLTRVMLFAIAPKVLTDGERHIALLRRSNLDWTVIRSPVMKDSGPADYTLSMKAPKPWASIPRVAVVSAMIHTLERGLHQKSSPFVDKHN